jgi:hypothetical protein
MKGYSSKRDSHDTKRPGFTNVWITTSGATLLNGFCRADDTIDYSAYFAPPVMALYNGMGPSLKGVTLWFGPVRGRRGIRY